MTLPYFLGIGAMKAGTTLLYELLVGHPDIFMPHHRKEVRYFDEHYFRGSDWYREQFSDSGGRRCGEISPNYLYDPHCAERICELVPNVKLIVILRNPVDRAYSQYRHAVREHGYDGPVQQFFEEHPNAVERGLYGIQLQRYLNRFKGNQIRIMVFEEFIKDPILGLRSLCEFLEVDSNFAPSYGGGKVNPGNMPRFPLAYRWIRVGASLLHKYDLSWVVAFGRRVGLKGLLFNSSSKVKGEPINPETTRWLRGQYEKDVSLTEELVGERLREIWGFGREGA